MIDSIITVIPFGTITLSKAPEGDQLKLQTMSEYVFFVQVPSTILLYSAGSTTVYLISMQGSN